jgi:hypothetical protein
VYIVTPWLLLLGSSRSLFLIKYKPYNERIYVSAKSEKVRKVKAAMTVLMNICKENGDDCNECPLEKEKPNTCYFSTAPEAWDNSWVE